MMNKVPGLCLAAMIMLAACSGTNSLEPTADIVPITPEATAPQPTATTPPERTPEPTGTPAPTVTATAARPTPNSPAAQEIARFSYRVGIGELAYRDGLTAAAGHAGAAMVYLYEADRLRWSAELEHGFPIAVAITPDGIVRVLAFGGPNNALVDLDLETGETLRVLAAPAILQSIMHPDGDLYLTNANHNDDSNKRVVDATTGKEVTRLALGWAQLDGTFSGTGVAWAGSDHLAIATGQGIGLWAAQSGEQTAFLPFDERPIRMQLGADGRYVTAVYQLEEQGPNTALVWEVETGIVLPTQLVAGTPAELSWNLDDGATYISNERFLFRVEGGTALAAEAISESIYWAKQVHLTEDGPLLQMADRVELYSPGWELQWRIVGHWHTPPSHGPFSAGSGWLTSPDGRYFALSSVSHHLLYDLGTGDLVGSPPGRVVWGPGAWSDDGRFASGTEGGLLTVWGADGEAAYQLPEAIYRVAWLGESSLLVALAEPAYDYEARPPIDHSTYSLVTFDLATGTLTERLPLEASPKQIAPKGQAVAVASGYPLDRSPPGQGPALSILELPGGEERWHLPLDAPAAALVWSPEGDRLAVYADDEAWIVDAATGEWLVDLTLPEDGAPRFWRWREDDTLLGVMGYQSPGLVTWDARSGAVRSRSLIRGAQGIVGLAETPAGLLLINFEITETVFTVLQVEEER